MIRFRMLFQAHTHLETHGRHGMFFSWVPGPSKLRWLVHAKEGPPAKQNSTHAALQVAPCAPECEVRSLGTCGLW